MISSLSCQKKKKISHVQRHVCTASWLHRSGLDRKMIQPTMYFKLFFEKKGREVLNVDSSGDFQSAFKSNVTWDKPPSQKYLHLYWLKTTGSVCNMFAMVDTLRLMLVSFRLMRLACSLVNLLVWCGCAQSPSSKQHTHTNDATNVRPGSTF